MRKILSAIVIVLITGPAMANDWNGQPTNGQFSLAVPGFNTYTFGTNSGASHILPLCGGAPSAQLSCPAGSPGVLVADSPLQPINALPSGVTSPGATTSVSVGGVYPDASSPSGYSFLQANVPLSNFATSSSVDALQAEIDQMNTFASEQNAFLKHFAAQGVAQALAMAGVGDIDSDQTVSVSVNFGTYEGQSAAAMGVAVRVNRNISFNAGLSGMGGATYGARAGFRVGW